MDIGSAFTFVFDDDDWIKKLAIGGGIAIGGVILLPLLLVGVVLFFPLSGYMLQVIKNVRDGHEKPLPEWDDFGGLFRSGFFVFLIWLVYNIPAFIFSCASALAQNAPQFADLNSDMVGTVVAVGTCLSCIQFILSVAAYIILPAGLIRYAQFDTFGSAFQFGEMYSFIRENIGDYVITVILSFVASFIAFFGVILCVIGVFFTTFWAFLVTGNLYGQLARKAQAPEIT